MSQDYYILEGRTPVPCSVEEWGRWHQNSNERFIKKTSFPDVIMVSTVFLGMNHSFRPNTPPVLFETLVFGGPMDEHMVRCATYDQAEINHEEVCALVKLALAGKLKLD